MIKIFSKVVFITMGAFHYMFNYALFMWNYMQGQTRWIYNNNSIGEATTEAIVMTLLMPFFVYGAKLIIVEISDKIKSTEHIQRQLHAQTRKPVEDHRTKDVA